MFPVGLVSGVFMSPWASNQMSPIFFLFRSRWNCDAPAMVPMAIEWSPPSTIGMRPSASTPATTSRRAAQVWRISFRYLSFGSPGSRVSGDRDLHVAVVGHVVAELADAGVDLGPAERRRAHVHAAAAGAEVEGNADERHLRCGVIAVEDASTPLRESVNGSGGHW